MTENAALPLIFTVCDAVRVSGFWALGVRKQNFNVLRSPTLFVFSVTEPETETASRPLLNNYCKRLCSRAGIRALRPGGLRPPSQHNLKKTQPVLPAAALRPSVRPYAPNRQTRSPHPSRAPCARQARCACVKTVAKSFDAGPNQGWRALHTTRCARHCPGLAIKRHCVTARALKRAPCPPIIRAFAVSGSNTSCLFWRAQTDSAARETAACVHLISGNAHRGSVACDA
jgi:hypothetical protein